MLSGGNNFPLRGNKVVMGSGYKRWVLGGVGSKILGFPQVLGDFANPNKLGFGYSNPSLKQGNYLGRGNSISRFYSLSIYSQKKG